MTGPEHYREAERILNLARESPHAERLVATAQVHATLALAAATADMAVHQDTYDEWKAVTQ